MRAPQACTLARLARSWRVGRSPGGFGVSELADDALAVLEARTTSVIPVASAHSGWVALELRRRLGRRVSGIVSLEWSVLGLPPQLREALAGMQSPDRWRQVVEGMHQRWLNGAQNPDLERFLRVGYVHGVSHVVSRRAGDHGGVRSRTGSISGFGT